MIVRFFFLNYNKIHTHDSNHIKSFVYQDSMKEKVAHTG